MSKIEKMVEKLISALTKDDHGYPYLGDVGGIDSIDFNQSVGEKLVFHYNFRCLYMQDGLIVEYVSRAL